MATNIIKTKTFELCVRLHPVLLFIWCYIFIKIEQGENINPQRNTLKKIARALEISIDELIDDAWYCKVFREGQM